MSGFINNLIGTGGAVLLAGLGVLAMMLAEHLTHRVVKIPRDILMVLGPASILLGGTLCAYTGAGTWLVSLAHTAGNWAGNLGGVVLTLGTFLLLIKVIKAHTAKRREANALYAAIFIFPIACTMFTFGIFHAISTHLQPVAQVALTHAQQFFGVA